ncbi:YaeQ family protein [Derxia lacustris]|uniref:YaeQ family protein n=1 Tax=Derxia lacustris TaxID=764842 RepID=UPI000A16F3B1|nr:YaeQ family protein [Derxia lacustris]
MALGSTIFKAQLQVNDLDRHYYASHALTIARHPSETDERMMVRVLAFGLHADESLVFGAGMTSDDNADLWHHDYTGRVKLWIDVGLPEARLVKKAAARSDRVMVYAYGRTAGMWWDKNRADLNKLDNLGVVIVSSESSQQLARCAERGMQLDCTIQDGEVMWTGADDAFAVALDTVKRAA